jgi:hypothetical protein
MKPRTTVENIYIKIQLYKQTVRAVHLLILLLYNFDRIVKNTTKISTDQVHIQLNFTRETFSLHNFKS